MIKDERVLELIEIIKKKKRIAVKELAEITFSSTSTLRRDLIFLENQGLIIKYVKEKVLGKKD